MNIYNYAILKELKTYLQELIDRGEHKIFYSENFFEIKVIDCINTINNLEEENKKLKKEVEEYKSIVTGAYHQMIALDIINKHNEIEEI